MSQQKIIRDGILQRLPAIPQFTNFHVGHDPSHQVQPADVPFIGVYLMPEEMNYDGAWNLTEPHFTHDADIGVSIILANNDGTELEDNLDAACDLVTLGLMSDPTFIGFQNIYQIEGIKKITRQHIYGLTGSTNEFPIGELRLTFTFTFRFVYPPDVRDVLKEIVLVTAYPSVEEKDEVQQVTMPMVFETVDPLPTETTVGSLPNPSAVDEEVTFNVEVLSHTVPAVGSARFTIDGNVAASVTLNKAGIAQWKTTTLALGDHDVIVDFLPDDDQFITSQATMIQTVQ